MRQVVRSCDLTLLQVVGSKVRLIMHRGEIDFPSSCTEGFVDITEKDAGISLHKIQDWESNAWSFSFSF